MPPPPEDAPPDVASVLAANRSFYEAFEASDMEAMSDLWDHGEGVVCTHPGWPRLEGWGAVSASFFALFQGDPPQFIVTGERATVVGDAAWVTCDETVLAGGGSAVASLNVFRRRRDGWRMVVHHAGMVLDQPS